MMTFDEMKRLLAFCAVHDRRKGDRLDVEAWLMVAEDHHWTAAAALRVAREHYGAGADRPRLEAPAITDRLRKVRSQAAESFELPRLPDDLPDADYPVWLRRQLAAHCDGQLERWAATGEEPSRALPTTPALGGGLVELVSRAPLQHRKAIAAGARTMTARRVRLDPVRRAEAEAELDAARRTEDAS